MFKVIQGHETEEHFCDNNPKKKLPLEVMRHDMKGYIYTEGKIIGIKFCPFCGVNLDNDR